MKAQANKTVVMHLRISTELHTTLIAIAQETGAPLNRVVSDLLSKGAGLPTISEQILHSVQVDNGNSRA